MEAHEILNLFDSNWFERKIVSNKLIPPPSPEIESPASESVHEKESKPFSAPKSLKVRSLSDRYLGVNPNNFFNEENEKQSLNTRPRLQKIVSGKELFDFYKEDADSQQKLEKKKQQNKRYRKEKGNISRSLSALEFEELKGFMDLGFVFTEEDKSSNLASIIPGLQKLGKNGEVDTKETKEEKVEVSRPYLSEAWSALEQKKLDEDKAAFMMNWRIPSAYNEIYMKNHLRVWAQSVASNIR